MPKLLKQQVELCKVFYLFYEVSFLVLQLSSDRRTPEDTRNGLLIYIFRIFFIKNVPLFRCIKILYKR